MATRETSPPSAAKILEQLREREEPPSVTVPDDVWEYILQRQREAELRLRPSVTMIDEPPLPESPPPLRLRLGDLDFTEERFVERFVGIRDGTAEQELRREAEQELRREAATQLLQQQEQLLQQQEQERLLQQQERRLLQQQERRLLQQQAQRAERRTFEDKYQQALLRGRERCSYGRVMFLGAAAVGKTSLRRGLMNQRLPRKARSTILAETRPVRYSWANAGNLSDHQWVEMTEDDEIAEEVRMIKNPVNTDREREEEEEPKDECVIQNKMMSVSYNLSQTRKLTEVAEHKEKVLQKVAGTGEVSQSKADHEVLLHLWDCGGQPVFLDVLPAFLSSRTMFILVFNASIGLEAPFRVIAFDDGQQKDQGMSVISTLTLFHKWMAMIHNRFGSAQDKGSYRVPLYPRIILVGTHADQIASSTPRHVRKKRRERLCAKMLKMFKESIKGKEYGDMILDSLILVNNTTAGTGSKADRGFMKIQQLVYEFVHDKLTKETPVSWIHFRKVLQLHTKKLKRVISLDEVYRIAAECHVPHDEVTSALLFYHELGVFLFYPEVKGLESVVILEPQWLVDQFGNLFASWKRKFGFSDMWDTLTSYGILIEPLYEDILSSVDEHNLAPGSLIEMLVHFLLAAPIVTTDLHTRSGIVKEYFVPHMLQHHLSQLPLTTTSNVGKRKDSLRPSKSCDVKMQSFPLEKAAPVHLTFRSGYVPPGYFVRLATSLATKQGVAVLFHPIYRDQIAMDIGVDKLTITEHIDTIELQYSRQITSDDPFRETCRRLLLLLKRCFSEVEQWLPGARIQLAFSCIECGREPHDTDILSRTKFCPFTNIDQHLRCKNGHKSMPTDAQEYWLHMNAIEREQVQFEKSLRLTKHVSPDVAFDLADQLGVNPLTAVIHQYRRIGGDDAVLVQALSDLKLVTQLDAAGQPVLDIDKSSSAASQISSGQIPVPDSSVSAVQQQETAVLDIDKSSSAAPQISSGQIPVPDSSVSAAQQQGTAALDVDESSSAAPQISPSQNPVPDTAVHSKCDRHTQTVSLTTATVLSFSKSTKRVSSTLEVSSTPSHTKIDSTDKASPMHSALNTPPELRDLLNKVASKARDKWKLVAIQLGIEPDHIHSIQDEEHSRPIPCYSEIFYVWRKSKASPYTWGTIIDALRAPAVEEQQLANELEEWLLSQ